MFDFVSFVVVVLTFCFGCECMFNYTNSTIKQYTNWPKWARISAVLFIGIVVLASWNVYLTGLVS